MPTARNLHDCLEELGRAIEALDAGDRRSVALVRSRFKAVQRVSTALERHVGSLSAVVGFDCSPPGHHRL